MKWTSFLRDSAAVCFVTFLPLYSRAQAQTSLADSVGNFSLDDNFRTGWHELTFGVGQLSSNIVRADNRPNIDYVMGYGSVGYMVTHPEGHGFFRGSFEVAPEIFGAGVYQGPGNYVTGGVLWFRYNFVQPNWRFVPYLEGGAGGSVLDIPSRFDGRMFNFNLEAGIGLRYFVQQNLSVNVEYRLQHISNADLWSHNVGVNTDGPTLGISFYF